MPTAHVDAAHLTGKRPGADRSKHLRKRNLKEGQEDELSELKQRIQAVVQVGPAVNRL